MRSALVAALAIAISATPLAAQDTPAAGKEPDAEDVAMTPLTDLNLRKDEIHPLLLVAATDPYTSEGLSDCKAIGGAIAALDEALGPDLDVAPPSGDRLSTGRVAKSLVASLIPFRGVVRELTGANEHERNQAAAIYAGSVRRGFLKGLGQQKGCPYPARPAFTRVTVAAPTRGEAKAVPAAVAGPVTQYVSEPVVQPGPKRPPRRK